MFSSQERKKKKRKKRKLNCFLKCVKSFDLISYV